MEKGKPGRLQNDPISLLPDGGERTEEAPETEPDILMAITTALVLEETHTHTQSIYQRVYI